jgi:hypothetical protein
MRAPETDAVPVAALDVTAGPELEVLSATALLLPSPPHAAAPINDKIVAQPRSTRFIDSPLGCDYFGMR